MADQILGFFAERVPSDVTAHAMTCAVDILNEALDQLTESRASLIDHAMFCPWTVDFLADACTCGAIQSDWDCGPGTDGCGPMLINIARQLQDLWAVVPDPDDVMIYFVADEGGDVRLDDICYPDFWQGASHKDWPFRAVVPAPADEE